MAFKMRNPFKQESIKNPKLKKVVAEMLKKGFTPTKGALTTEDPYAIATEPPKCPEGKVWDPKTKTCIIKKEE